MKTVSTYRPLEYERVKIVSLSPKYNKTLIGRVGRVAEILPRGKFRIINEGLDVVVRGLRLAPSHPTSPTNFPIYSGPVSEEAVDAVMRLIDITWFDPIDTMYLGGISRPTREAIAGELAALVRDYSNVKVEVTSNITFRFTTDNIVLEDKGTSLALGKFEVKISFWYSHCVSMALSASALTPNNSGANRNLTHPHVSHKIICMGDSYPALCSSVRDFRLWDAAFTVNAVLHSYSEDHCYEGGRIDQWYGAACSNCGDCGEDSPQSCVSCEEDCCENCEHTSCSECDSVIHDGCLDGDEYFTNCECGNHLCENCGIEVYEGVSCNQCWTKCQECKDKFLTKNIEDGMCGGCRDQTPCTKCEVRFEPDELKEGLCFECGGFTTPLTNQEGFPHECSTS